VGLRIPYTKEILPNGLTVLVSEDHKAPLVAVSVWYHVGSKDERPGRTGFAHLFEHLMFEGSAHFDDEFFRPLERAGATQMNGTTGRDRTNYFATVPTEALDLLLWLESDRMAHLILDQPRLDEQRGVVLNEKRQGENQPYGRLEELLAQNSYPKGHPYSWTVIGDEHDLKAATLDDVRQWFRDYYGAANATLVVVGDVATAEAMDKVRRYFGAVPPGVPMSRQRRWVARMAEEHRVVLEDDVAQDALVMAWNVPPLGDPVLEVLRLAARMLGGGRSSRLYQRLVLRDELVTEVDAAVEEGALGSQFAISAFARPGVQLGAVESAILESLAEFAADGPGDEELRRAQTMLRAAMFKAAERLGGFSGRTEMLAEGQVLVGSPDWYRRQMKTWAKASCKKVREAVRDHLDQGRLVVEVHRFGTLQASDDPVDRNVLPQAPRPQAIHLPGLQHAVLGNGLELVLAQRSGSGIAAVRLLVEAGAASDGVAKAGLAALTSSMLLEGTGKRSGVEVAQEAERLGASLGASAGLDMASVQLTTLLDNLGASLALLADVVINPAFRDQELARVKAEYLAAIAQEKTDPASLAMRLLPPLLYGPGHPYAAPFTGTGSEQTIAAIARDDLLAVHHAYYRPDRSRLLVVGDVSLDQLVHLAEQGLGRWHGSGVAARMPDVPPVQGAGRLYFLDRPRAEQTVIMAATLAPPVGSQADFAIMAANMVLGGLFTSRLNMNLREDKSWTYGVRSMLPAARLARPFLIDAPVEAAATAPALQEILRELRDILGERPITTEELEQAKDALIRRLPGSFETNRDVALRLAHVLTYQLPEDYYDRMIHAVSALTTDDIQEALPLFVQPEQMLWVLVGDRARVAAEVCALHLGDWVLLDVDGNPREDHLCPGS
jgi:zinc protease